jgi:N-acetylglucosamine kinase-like BadF-type ATPase
MKAMQYFLGVDAGGTKTEFVLGDESRELARVRAGTIKRMKADAATAEDNLQTALRELHTVTGISLNSITRCCIGTAGETVPLVVHWLREAFARHVGGELIMSKSHSTLPSLAGAACWSLLGRDRTSRAARVLAKS